MRQLIVKEHLIKGSNNITRLLLTEDDSAIPDVFSEIQITIGPVQITRLSNIDGVELTAGFFRAS